MADPTNTLANKDQVNAHLIANALKMQDLLRQALERLPHEKGCEYAVDPFAPCDCWHEEARAVHYASLGETYP